MVIQSSYISSTMDYNIGHRNNFGRHAGVSPRRDRQSPEAVRGQQPPLWNAVVDISPSAKEQLARIQGRDPASLERAEQRQEQANATADAKAAKLEEAQKSNAEEIAEEADPVRSESFAKATENSVATVRQTGTTKTHLPINGQAPISSPAEEPNSNPATILTKPASKDDTAPLPFYARYAMSSYQQHSNPV